MFNRILDTMVQHGLRHLRKTLKRIAVELRGIPMKGPVHQVPTILLVGEIYVRAEGLARRWLPEFLAQHGIATHMAPLHEWMHYVHHEFIFNRYGGSSRRSARIAGRVKWNIMKMAERDVNNILSKSGWYVRRLVDMKGVMDTGSRFISHNLQGEAILTVGGSLAEIGTHFCGSIAIGPFGCMPNRLSEAILSVNSDREHLTRFRKDRETERVTARMETMPFLAIESDGSPFPQIIEARLETFILQARRLHDIMTNRDADLKPEFRAETAAYRPEMLRDHSFAHATAAAIPLVEPLSQPGK
jgi:hypothetical protein